jgi:hypothetical protein
VDHVKFDSGLVAGDNGQTGAVDADAGPVSDGSFQVGGVHDHPRAGGSTMDVLNDAQSLYDTGKHALATKTEQGRTSSFYPP